MDHRIDRFLKKDTSTFKNKMIDRMIDATVVFCILYTGVYLFLNAKIPALVEAVIGGGILLIKLLVPTTYEKYRIILPLNLSYVLIVVQTVLFFGGAYGFQYMLFAHIATVIVLFSEKNMRTYRTTLMGIYLIVTLIVIYQLEQFKTPIYPVGFAQQWIEQFRLSSVMAFMVVMIYLLSVYVKEQQAAEEKLRYLSRYDDRFEVLNYTTLIKLGEALFETDEHFTLFLTDTDYFKSINDTYGHDCGDAVLKYLSDQLKQMDGPRAIARYGGSTFAVIALEVSSKDLKERLDHFVYDFSSQPVEIGTRVRINTTISVGIVSRYNDIINFSGMLSRADEALYLAKAKGGNQTVIIGK